MVDTHTILSPADAFAQRKKPYSIEQIRLALAIVTDDTVQRMTERQLSLDNILVIEYTKLV